MTVFKRQNKPFVPSLSDIELSRISSRILASAIDSHSPTQKIKIESPDGKEHSLLVPRSAYQLFVDALIQISQRKSATLIPVERELTTQQAANILNVSRPYLIELLEKGEIPYHMVGSHRRILAEDLATYQNKTNLQSDRALDELTALTEKLGLYDNL